MNDFETIRRNSRDIANRTTEYQSELKALEAYEYNVHHLNTKFANVEPSYKGGEYSLLIDGDKEFPIADKVISDVIGKTGVDFESNKRVFDAIKHVPNLSNAELPIGYDYIKQILDVSKRDVRDFSTTEHRLIIYDNIARSLMNHDAPYNAFNVSDFGTAFDEVADMKGKSIESPRLNFNQDTGRVSMKLTFDKLNIENASVNDEVGYSVDIKTGKYGGITFSMRIGLEVLACTNGMTSLDTLSMVKIRNTSYKNYANKLGDFLDKNLNLHNLDRKDQAIVQYMRLKDKMPTGDYLPRMYSLIASTVFDVAEKKKDDQKIILETAAATNIEEFDKLLDNVWNEKRLPMRDKEIAKEVWENDDLINNNKPSLYDFSNMFSRMANNPTWSEDKIEDYQKVAYEVLVPATP